MLTWLKDLFERLIMGDAGRAEIDRDIEASLDPDADSDPEAPMSCPGCHAYGGQSHARWCIYAPVREDGVDYDDGDDNEAA